MERWGFPHGCWRGARGLAHTSGPCVRRPVVTMATAEYFDSEDMTALWTHRVLRHRYCEGIERCAVQIMDSVGAPGWGEGGIEQGVYPACWKGAIFQPGGTAWAGE